MGVTESKLALVTLSAACSTAEENGRNDIKHVLSDKQFIKCLTTLWKHLPEPSKIQIAPGSRRTRQATKTLKDQKITLSEPTKSNIDLWRRNPGSFLDAIPCGESSTQMPCPVSAIYRSLSETEIRNSADTVRLRFLKVLFHSLKDRCCAIYLRQNAIEWMTVKVVAAGLDNGDRDEISRKIKNWSFVGGKYDALSRDIGGKNGVQNYGYLGNLFCLPEDVTDRFILKELPASGNGRKRVIDSFMRRGIRELDQIETMDDLANRVFSLLWNKLESSIGPNESEMIGVSAYLKDTCHLQGARIIRLQDGNCGSPRRSNETDSQCDTGQSSIAGETPQTGPIDAVYSGMPGGASHFDYMHSAYPGTGSAAHIDPMDAVYPSMPGGPSQLDSMHTAYPGIESAAHIDPMDAVYPSMLGRPSQLNYMHTAYPGTGSAAHIDPMDAVYPTLSESVHTTYSGI